MRRHPLWYLSLLVVILFTASSLVLTRGNPEEQIESEESVLEGVPGFAAETIDGQPIAFSHKRHVTQAGIRCQFCHAYARRGPVAGIPSVQRCVGCHRTILSETAEVMKILDFWENENPIPWTRIHNLPDYVRFSHKAHVRGNVDCAECHGDVGQMNIAEQVESLSMGWCLNCHKERNVSRDCLLCHY